MRTRRAMVVDMKKCPLQIMEAEHWNEKGVCLCQVMDANRETCPKRINGIAHWNWDGTCKCVKPTVDPVWLDAVRKILEGSYTALEILSDEELSVLSEEYATRSMKSGASKEEMAMDIAISRFLIGVRETRSR
jgi:hypothetical protein